MIAKTAIRYWLLALALCATAVPLCVAYLDRPLAVFLEEHIRHTEAWIWLDRVLRLFEITVVAALCFLVGCGIWSVSGRRLHPSIETPLLCSWGAMWAVAADIIFKRIFGRSWPDPAYIRDHLYGFHLLHGEPPWQSFPSGTAAVSVAIAAVLWSAGSRWRGIGLIFAAFASAGVVVGNFHWLSDVIAGAFLGAFIGASTVRLLRPPMHLRSP